MNEDDGSRLIPAYGDDLEAAREAEVESLGSPQQPTTWQKWAAVATLGIVGIAMFLVATLLSSGIPASGDAAAEARVTALVTIGATASAAAVTLAAVVLTLGLQREQEQQQRWADFQHQVLREAYHWIDGVYGQFGEILGAIQEWGYAVESEQADKLDHANRVAQRFYDDGQQLHEVERLERLVTNRDVRAALRAADGALRGWNETVAGNHTTRAVHTDESGGTEWAVFQSLGKARNQVLNAYADAVRGALMGVEGHREGR